MLNQSNVKSVFGSDAFPKIDHSGNKVRLVILNGQGVAFQGRWCNSLKEAENYTEGMTALYKVLKGAN